MSSPTPNRQHKSRQGEISATLSAPQSHPRESSRSRELNLPIRSVTESQRRERPPPPPLPLSRSESQLPKDNDYTCSPGYTDNVTSQRSWREKDTSVKTSSRPRLPRYQPRSGSETFSPLEAPKLQQETVYSSNKRQPSQGTPNKMARLAVTSNSRIGSEVSNHSRESPHSGGVPNHLNNSPHHPSDTQKSPRSQIERPKHVDPTCYRSVNAQVQANLHRKVQTGPGPVLSANAGAPPQPQRGAPSYFNPISQRPSNFQGQSAQQDNFNEGRRQGQPIPPQLVAAPANSRSLPQELNVPKRSIIESQRRLRPAPVTSDFEDTPGHQRSPSPPHFKDRRNTSSKDGKKYKKKLSYVRKPQASLFKSSRMDQKSTEKSITGPGETTLGGVWVRESGITQRSTKNSKAWKPSSSFLGYSWASGDKFVTRRQTKKADDQDREKKLQHHRFGH
ncbi:hypothetical protein BTUL_0191g00150 [Botrytis tulipae]|uniref:Uncharacterized protein n=1 Tax=Botrytis tulipae TaxID=87230 RepID=A0A4Z1E9G7_9HELO|nr:hypothetical protein BTUL_0191g00150 [Botrytis tulipae]